MIEHFTTNFVQLQRGWTPLHAAADACQLATLRVLLEEGLASATIETSDGLTALHLAARHARDDLVSYLLRSGQLRFYSLLRDPKANLLDKHSADAFILIYYTVIK